MKKTIYIWLIATSFMYAFCPQITAQGNNPLLGVTPEEPHDLGVYSEDWFCIDREKYFPSGYEQNFIVANKVNIYTKITLRKKYYIEFFNEICESSGSGVYIQVIVRNSNREIIYNEGEHTSHCPSYYFDPGVYYIEWFFSPFSIYTNNFYSGDYYEGDICALAESDDEVDVPVLEFVVPVTTLTSQNYILTKTPRVATSDINRISTNDMSMTYQYFDGLGRLKQTVDRNITPLGKDLVTVQEYDIYGRESRQWLPIPYDTGGSCISSSIVQQAITFYNDQHPYSQPVYEKSPLNRTVEELAPGADWQKNGKTVKTNYSSTISCVKYSSTDVKATTSITYLGYYPENELFVTQTTDEDGNISYEVKNMQEQTILIRQVCSEGQTSDTYYVYDIFGNLRAVIPPEATSQFTSGKWTEETPALNKYVYIYHYDDDNRCIAKKLPGCEWVYYIYDKAGRLIFSQDGVQRVKKEWTFSIPDDFGRVVLTGICKNSQVQTADTLKNNIVKAQWANTNTICKGYFVTGIHLVSPSILSVNYYDHYEFMGLDGIPNNTTVQYNSEAGYDVRDTGGCKGLLTGTLQAQLLPEGALSSVYLYSVMYYDYRGRCVQTKSNNHMNGGLEKEYLSYNFVGQIIKKKHVHEASGKSTQIQYYTYEYDQAGRLLKTRHKLNSGTEVILAEHTYDELGRMKSNKRNGLNSLQTNYAYNIRSWIKSLNTGNLFTQTLYYNDSYAGNTPCYNGNISAMNWTVSGNSIVKGYKFSYDHLSRLKSADYMEDAVLSARYSTSYTYDKQGNITTLKCYGPTGTSTYGLIDNLTMIYNGNQLIKVEDTGVTPSLSSSADFRNGPAASTEYFYDANGSLTKDLNKGISNIEYNSLNLPGSLVISNSLGSATNTYVYAANGSKLSVSKGSLKTDYVGSVIYENGIFKRLLVEGGYYENGMYHFYICDHLGNNRVVANQNAAAIQSTHYYPFGMAFADGVGQAVQPYKYNGKELDSDRGLNWYDYIARSLDFALGRFTTMDPMAEDYYSWSPYIYCFNNPLRFIDPDGMQATDSIKYGGVLPTVEVEGKKRNKVESVYVLRAEIKNGPELITGYPEFLPGLSAIKWASLWKNIKSIPGLIKNMGTLLKTGKMAGGFSKTFISSLNKIVSVQKQARHIVGVAENSTKGYLNSLTDAQKVLDAVHNGTAQYLGTTAQGHVLVKCTTVTGTNVNRGVGITNQPTNLFLIKGTTSPSVVPTNPNYNLSLLVP